jgi:tetratricopeptide (TPR) repeat protein
MLVGIKTNRTSLKIKKIMKKKMLLWITIFIYSITFSQQAKIDSLKVVLEKSVSEKEKLRILNELNKELISSSTPDESIVYFEEMAQLSKRLNNIDFETTAFRYLSESFMRKNDIERSLMYANKSFNINDNLHRVNATLVDLNQIGRIYHHFQNYIKAVKTYTQAIKIYDEKKEGKAISTIYGNLGVTYSCLNDNKRAIQCYVKQAQLADRDDNIDQKSNAYYNIGYIYMEIEQYQKAEEYFNKALNDSLNVTLKTYVYRNYHGLGLTYSRWGKYDKAIDCNEKALYFFKSTNNKLYVFDVLNNMAIVYLKKENKIKALEYANEALKIATEINNKLAINGANLTLVDIYLYSSQYNKANYILKNLAKDTANAKIVNKEMKISIYNSLYQVNKAKKKYKKALKFIERQKELSESLIKNQRDNKITEIEEKYQNVKNEKLLLIKEKEINIEKNKNQKYIIFILLLSLISILSTIAYSYYHRKFIRNKAEITNMINKIKAIEKELFKVKSLNSEIKVADEFNKDEFNKFLMKKYFIKKHEIIEIWESIANGISRKEFADKNRISENTIKSWRNELYDKLKKATFTTGRYSDYKAVIEYYNSLRWYESLLLSDTATERKLA